MLFGENVLKLLRRVAEDICKMKNYLSETMEPRRNKIAKMKEAVDTSDFQCYESEHVFKKCKPLQTILTFMKEPSVQQQNKAQFTQVYLIHA